MTMTRRGVVAASSAMAAAPAMAASAGSTVAADLERYLSFGNKRSGGPGDEATGAWLEGRLRALGFKTWRQGFEVPFIEDAVCRLSPSGGGSSALLAQAPYVTGVVEGRVYDPASGRGEIAVVSLPHGRWSSLLQPPVQAAIQNARATGAKAVLLKTTGPSGKALALNALPALAAPDASALAILAPEDSTPVSLAIGQAARFELSGRTGLRPAWNLIGELDRGADRWLVVSTPRSGWFTCGGERGGGIAAWLALAFWAVRNSALNLAFLSTSGHEYENHGGHQAIAHAMPKADKTALWFHLGANVASRDWHELGGRLSPLPGADSQRLLVATPTLIDKARAAFAGLPGLEAPYPSSAGAAGELGEILKAGYAPAAGIFGSHRLHHAETDDARCLHPPLVEAATAACLRFVEAALRA
ncbi:hypothetical protein [Caulobacter sp. NIBR1757]|uniref:hypothetical protein n=1 Tax=Caulobacter sp. NIBR1757 TaxID=3016000 RepID=UPI0022F0DF03|nr:hypothetical protein [Caulobacter sp. NIBR1757]WGM37695.1 hypothetical protein AMEJIAPC_00595 [Caulobacter sp. NIBR1757]